jgi:hypothetical protein
MRIECERGLARTLQGGMEAERLTQEKQARQVHTNGDVHARKDSLIDDKNLPWERAAALLPELTRERGEHATSSVRIKFHLPQRGALRRNVHRPG